MTVAPFAGHHTGSYPLLTTPEALVAHPAYFAVLQQCARHLVGLYDHFPRVARLVSSQQKWLLSQAAYALYLQRDPEDPLSGITASRLLDIMVKFGAASRNTAAAFLAELLAYKLIQDVPGNTNRRSRPLEPTAVIIDAMEKWFRGQMHSLDLLDGGTRVVRLDADPTIFHRAQPIAARQLIEDRAWREPPASIASFVWTENGGLLLDDIMSKVVTSGPSNRPYLIEDLSFSELSIHYGLSRTHIRRLFTRAEESGWVGRTEKIGRKRHLSVSPDFINAYMGWQAIKHCALDRAFAIAAEGPAHLTPGERMFQLLEAAN
ncbi:MULTISPECIES: hypothetical protein [unclassified Rhizobium]|uniref:hypothetical protein n=1 Tax=unclassified Rhizobium TaxID=2613769 RepID=UPI00070191E0|nr:MULTISPECIES: hypothetical protein [unclassified Rhizobium]KQV34755.1 hypothetical protein ASC86_14660 [Rhizobium sp. Root1212]KRD24089.1 hypothetical protein ASE37_14655 [Rhizobium sp. Root268]